MRKFISTVFVILIACTASSVAGSSTPTHHALVSVPLQTDSQLRQLYKLHLDVVPGEDRLEPYIIAQPRDLETLRQAGFTYSYIHADLEQFYADRARAEGHLDDMGGYKTFTEIVAALDTMHARYPNLTTEKYSIGTSVEGRTLWCLKISDNPTIDENEPEVLYNALIHAREPAAMEVVIYFMNYLLENYSTRPDIAELVNGRELFFIPCANPDGYEYNRINDPDGGGLWRKNRRNNGDGTYGIDLNRNWGLTWGLDDEGSSPFTSDETYRGTAAFSEPETAAFRDFINSRNFIGSLDYHTYSNIILFPWGTDYYQGTGLCVDDPEFRVIVDSMSAAIAAVNGSAYRTGPPWELLYNTNGGSFEWEYGDTTGHAKMYSISTEVGTSTDGFWPAPSRILPLCQENLPANIFYARYVGTLEQGMPRISISPAQLDVGIQIGDIVTRNLRISNTGERDLIYRVNFSSGTMATDTGGPDSYGYRWQDSDQNCGPSFHWLPVSDLGTSLTFGSTEGDAVRGPYLLGFPFSFYGIEYDRIWISANGWISFRDSVYTGYTNRALPSVSAPAACICAWWDDLKPQLAGTNVRYWSNGVDSAVVHFGNVRAGTSPNQGTYNFQILLTPDGEAKINYGEMGTIRLNSSTIAIQDHVRTRGLTVLSNAQGGIGNNIALRFSTGPRWISVSSAGGTIHAGDSDTLSLFIDGTQLCGEPTVNSLLIRSNDVTIPNYPVRVYVTTTLPETPAGLTVLDDNGYVVLRWNAALRAQAYLIERGYSADGPFELIGTSADTSYVDSTAGVEVMPLFYQVRSTTEAVSASFSLPATR